MNSESNQISTAHNILTLFSFLFWTFFAVFSRIFGCTLLSLTDPSASPTSSSSSPFLGMAATHRYMDLNNHQISHFINQIALASAHFGFSANDSAAINVQMNTQFNTRCSPPISDTEGDYLYSLCQDPSCPLAFPSPDCGDYPPSSGPPATNPNATQLSTSSTSLYSTSSTSTTSSSNSATSSNISPSHRDSSISTGGIVGASVAAVIGLSALIGFAVFLVRRSRSRKNPQAAELNTTTRQEMDNQHYSGMREMDSNQFKVPEMPG